MAGIEWNTVVTAVTGQAALLGAAAWIANAALKRYMTSVAANVKSAADERLEELKSALATHMEQVKRDHSKDLMVFKTHFDTEFNAYVELWNSVDASYNNHAYTVRRYDVYFSNENAIKKEINKVNDIHNECIDNLNNTRKLRPWVQEDIYNKATSIIGVSQAEVREFMDCCRLFNRVDFNRKPVALEAKKKVEDVRKDYDELADMIRRRVMSMYVLDDGLRAN